MAIYHLSVKMLSRSDGRDAVAAAAYRAGQKLKNEKTGETHDYTKKRNVIETTLIFPEKKNAKISREKLWNSAEQSEKRKNSSLAREFEIALPEELPRDAQIELAKRFAQEIADKYHVAADLCVHSADKNGDQRNIHAHILTTTRRVDEHGELGEKARELDDYKTRSAHVEQLRERWAALVNDELEKHGVKERIDHRTLAAQGIDRAPQIHVGVHATQMERRGIETERGAENRKRQELNRRVDELKAELTAEQEKAAAAARVKTAAKNAPEKPQPAPQKAVSPTQRPVEAPKTAETPKTTPKPQDMAKKAVLGADKAKRIGIYAIYDGVMDGEYCITCDEEPLVGPFETKDKAAAYLDGHKKEIEQLAADYKHGQPIQQPREYYTREEIKAAEQTIINARKNYNEWTEKQLLKDAAKGNELYAEIRKRQNELYAQKPERKILPLLGIFVESEGAYDTRLEKWKEEHKAEFEAIDELRDMAYTLTATSRRNKYVDARERVIREKNPEAARIVAWAENQKKLEQDRMLRERIKEKLQQKSRGFEIGD